MKEPSKSGQFIVLKSRKHGSTFTTTWGPYEEEWYDEVGITDTYDEALVLLPPILDTAAVYVMDKHEKLGLDGVKAAYRTVLLMEDDPHVQLQAQLQGKSPPSALNSMFKALSKR